MLQNNPQDVSNSVGSPQPGVDLFGKPAIRLTFRSVMVGFLLAMVIAVWVPYCNYVMHGPRLTLSHMSIAALILFFLVIFFVQIPLQRLQPSWAFTAPELAVIFSLLLMSSSIPGKAFVDYFLGILATPYYYATPENRWIEVFSQYLPEWLIINNDRGAVQGFYEGVGENAFLWGEFVFPLLWWFNMLAALFVIMACITVIFRKQWVEHERLAFPLVRIPIELIAQTSRSGQLPDFMKSRHFWVGFGVTFGLLAWNCLSYFGDVPAIPIGTNFRTNIQWSTSIPPTPVQFNIFMMCFAFFAELHVLMSICVFYLLAILEIGIFNELGLSASGVGGGASFLVKTQQFGGFWVFVIWGFWIARHHLQSVLMKALGRSPEVDDSNELFSYRFAVVGLVIGLLYLGFWLNAMGMSIGVATLFLTITLLLYVGVARIVAETGLVFLDLPVDSNVMTVGLTGSNSLSPQDLTALALTHTVSHNHRGIGMSSLIHSLKVTDTFATAKKGFFIVICLLLALTFAVTNGYTIYAGSMGSGAHNFGPINATGYYNQLVTWFNNPFTMSYEEIYFLGFGGLVMLGLIFLHYQFPGWPLHPIGYTVAYTDIIQIEIVSIFMVWLVKWMLLRMGGFELYRKTQPVVIGILLGYAAGVALSFMVDVTWFPGRGHNIHNW
jgi:hypothetical protein